eukprot:396801-Pyramimonas_sp.AAC.1
MYIKEEENLPGPGVRRSARLQHAAAEKAMVAVALYESHSLDRHHRLVSCEHRLVSWKHRLVS